MARRGSPAWLLKEGVRRFLRSGVVQFLLIWLVRLWTQFVWVSGRHMIEGEAHIGAIWDAQKSAVLATWHGRGLMAPYAWQSRNPHAALTSPHSDGQAIGRYFRTFGVKTIRGAGTGRASRKGQKNKGGLRAFREMLRNLDAGVCVWLTADIPPGPAKISGEGTVKLAAYAGVPIVPIAVRTRRRRVIARSWDKMHIPLPFGRIAIVWGAPIYVPKDADAQQIEAIRAALDDALNAVSRRANALVGR